MPPATNSSKLEISRDDLLKYIELDLWSRFQGRLWAMAAIFVTAVSIAGVLGVPESKLTAIAAGRLRSGSHRRCPRASWHGRER
jgi:hypothetical protein